MDGSMPSSLPCAVGVQSCGGPALCAPVVGKSAKKYTLLGACAGQGACQGHWRALERFLRALPESDLANLMHAVKVDIDQVVDFYQTLFNASTREVAPRMVIGFYDDRVVSVGTMFELRTKTSCELNFIVDPNFRQDGVARSVLMCLLELAREQAFTRAYVEVTGTHARAMMLCARSVRKELFAHTCEQDGDERTYIFDTSHCHA